MSIQSSFTGAPLPQELISTSDDAATIAEKAARICKFMPHLESVVRLYLTEEMLYGKDICLWMADSLLRKMAQERAMDELTAQAQELDMGY